MSLIRQPDSPQNPIENDAVIIAEVNCWRSRNHQPAGGHYIDTLAAEPIEEHDIIREISLSMWHLHRIFWAIGSHPARHPDRCP
jgi:hypothetical protein